ncbi:MAG: hypothetical protein IT307_07620 [Chloroflexi bacterium]|nr:hypothetical protein [Chloroflexota bacterium]
MPFTMEDLDRVKIRVGTADKTLRQMSDNQFTAWLRYLGAEGDMTIVQLGPGKYMTPIEDRIRILNDLEARGFPIPGLTAPADAKTEHRPRHDRRKLEAFEAAVQAAATDLELCRGLAQELGEIDPRVNLRQTMDGALALIEAARGAAERALKQAAE